MRTSRTTKYDSDYKDDNSREDYRPKKRKKGDPSSDSEDDSSEEEYVPKKQRKYTEYLDVRAGKSNISLNKITEGFPLQIKMK